MDSEVVVIGDRVFVTRPGDWASDGYRSWRTSADVQGAGTVTSIIYDQSPRTYRGPALKIGVYVMLDQSGGVIYAAFHEVRRLTVIEQVAAEG